MLRIRSLLLIAFSFLSGAFAAGAFEWLAPITTVKITNVSGKTIRHIDIEHRGMNDGSVEGSSRIALGLQPDQQVTFKLITESEAGYRLNVTFEDGTTVNGGSGYTSRGATTLESISIQEITSQAPMALTFGLLYEEARVTTWPRPLRRQADRP